MAKIDMEVFKMTNKEFNEECNKEIGRYLQEDEQKYEAEEKDDNITQIPLTKTGYVSKYCREKCLTWKEFIIDTCQK